ncbi:MAG: hypothetical protein AB1861_10135 [Cyanobacteriota bacterium]
MHLREKPLGTAYAKAIALVRRAMLMLWLCFVSYSHRQEALRPRECKVKNFQPTSRTKTPDTVKMTFCLCCSWRVIRRDA